LTLNKFRRQTRAYSDEANRVMAESLKATGLDHIRQLIDRNAPISKGNIEGLGEAYTSAGGRKSTVNTGETTATFDTNKYGGLSFGDQPYVVIEATSITGSWNINNCNIVQIDTGKWVLFCNSGSNAVKRAQIYKTLFYGTNGSNPRASSSFITGITALKTSVSRDVGKRAWYAIVNQPSTTGSSNRGYNGVFNNTTTNDDCSVWSFCFSSSGGGSVAARMYFPDGSIKNSANQTTSDHTGTDREADELTNPADTRLEVSKSAAGTHSLISRAFYLLEGTITWTSTGSGAASSTSNTDFLDEGIPAFTLADDLSDTDLIITHDIPAGFFDDDVTNVFGISFIEDIDTGGQVDFKLSDGAVETDWFPMGNEAAINPIPAMTPTKVIVRIQGVASETAIRGIWVRATP